MKIVYIDCFYGFDINMLLGALADIKKNRSEHIDEEELVLKGVTRLGVECTLAYPKDASSPREVCESAVISILQSLGADCVICSSVALSDDADGNIITTLEKSGIDTTCADHMCTISKDDADFLSRIITECAPRPDMTVTDTGYGASMSEDSGFMCVSVGEIGSQSPMFFNTETMYEDSKSK